MQTRDQVFAAAIFSQIKNEVKGWEPDEQKKYGAMAHRLPVLIRTAGLAQALAFVEARGTPKQQTLLTHLGEVVGKRDLAESARAASLAEYMKLTHQTLAALGWYKRFAQSVLEVDGSEEGDPAS